MPADPSPLPPPAGAAASAADGPSDPGEVLELFPRYLLRGRLPSPQLAELIALAGAVAADPDSRPDASTKLAGQLALQRELALEDPSVRRLCDHQILPACERWLRHVIDRQPPAGRGPWTPGRYGLQMIDLWLNVQRAGDYNPAHTHGGSFSGVIFLKVPPQIHADSFDGQLCFHGPEEWHIQSFRTGMAHYVLPIPGEFYVFPAWQPHSVAPFRGEGERWSIAFNVVAVPRPAGSLPPPAKCPPNDGYPKQKFDWLPQPPFYPLKSANSGPFFQCLKQALHLWLMDVPINRNGLRQSSVAAERTHPNKKTIVQTLQE